MLIWLSLAPVMWKIKDLPKQGGEKKKVYFYYRACVLAVAHKIINKMQKTVGGPVMRDVLQVSAEQGDMKNSNCTVYPVVKQTSTVESQLRTY